MTGPSPLRVWYGGTFDPFHDGHLATAIAARDALETAIRLLPAADPPHRAAPGAGAAQRARMVELGIAGIDGLALDLREITRQGASYSILTVRELRAEFGDAAPLALLVGADSFLDLPQWREWRALLGLVHFVIADRPGSPLDARLPAELASAMQGRWAPSVAALAAAPAGLAWPLRQALRAESATAIRRAIAQGATWRDRVPAAVAGYIVQQGLYGAGAILPAT